MPMTDDELLKEIREFYELTEAADSENRQNAVADLEFLNGDQWPAQIKAQRQLEGRPCLTFNRLPTYLHQVTNDQRQNKPSIKIHPVGDGADVKKAEIIQGLIRHIEYSSNADIAYDTAVNSAAAIGFGFFQLVTEYESPDSFDQVIRFKRIRNPLTCRPDPASIEADGSDMKKFLIVGDEPRDDFKRQYPEQDMQTSAFLQGMGTGVIPGWMSDKFIRVCQYYYFEYEKKTICQLSDGSIHFESDLNILQKMMIEQKRETIIPQLMWCKATAGAVLEKTPIMCKWIPVFPVWGTEIDIEGRVFRSGIIRYAKDPAQMYNYWMTSATEEVSLRPKIPYIGAEGQFEDHENEWEQANTRSFAYLEYKPVTIDGVLAPAPQRQPMADVPIGLLQMANHAADNIKAVTGLFDSALGARGSATSGKQELSQQRQADTTNFHYSDNLNRTIRHCGRCLVDMFPHYYDGRRILRIMQEDGKMDSAEVNIPQVDPLTQQITEVLNDLTVGEYDVTVATGPSYSTLRQEAAESMVSVAQSWPKLMEVAGDKVIASMDWPGADEISERIKKSMPPELTQDKDADDGGPPPLPPEIEQHIQMAEQHIQELEKALQEAQAGITKAQMDNDARKDVARINAESAAEVAEINADKARDVEELKGMVAQVLAHLATRRDLELKAVEVQQTGSEEFNRPEESQSSEQAQPGPTDEMSA